MTKRKGGGSDGLEPATSGVTGRQVPLSRLDLLNAAPTSCAGRKTCWAIHLNAVNTRERRTCPARSLVADLASPLGVRLRLLCRAPNPDPYSVNSTGTPGST